MQGTRADIIRQICAQIEHIYTEPNERRNIALLVASTAEGVSHNRYLIEPNESINIPTLETIVAELAEGRPVQYVMGTTEFCGLEFAVKEGVLIPRPETEELVCWAIERAEEFDNAEVLDLCTGSGCIAISIARRVNTASITAIDLSTEALEIARQNNKTLNANVNFIEADVLGDMTALGEREFDIIISNPPYIPYAEEQLMRVNVTQYEPKMALFVEDDKPLLFYEAIATHALHRLRRGGYLLFEVHENYAAATAKMLQEQGFDDVIVRNDFRAKPRMICCRLNRK